MPAIAWIVIPVVALVAFVVLVVAIRPTAAPAIRLVIRELAEACCLVASARVRRIGTGRPRDSQE